MVNHNYNRGRAKEYKICKRLREAGFDIVQRSAGSHSVVDIWAVRRSDNTMRLTQVKPEKMSATAKQRLLEENAWLDTSFEVEFVVE